MTSPPSQEAREGSPTGRLTIGQRITYAFPHFSLAVTGALIIPWLTYFYVGPEGDRKEDYVPLMNATLFAAVMFGGRLVDAIADPFIGYWSDRCRSPKGRRIPFMLYGTPFMALTFFALWFPPFEPGSVANGVYFTVVLAAFWFLFTAVVGPYTALLPEIATTTEARVEVSSYMGVANVIGMIVAAAGIGPLDAAYPNGIELFGIHFRSGIQLFAVFASATMFLFLLPIVNIRETPYDSNKEVPAGLFKGMKSAFSNPAFRTFLGIATFVQMGLIMLITALPFFAKQILERREGEAGLVAPGQGTAWFGYLMAIMVLCALIWIPAINKLVKKFGKKRLMVVIGFGFSALALTFAAVPYFPDPAVAMIGIVMCMSAPSAAALILAAPMYADVVDHDEKQTGVRREGIYTGAMSVLGKAAVGAGNSVVVLLLGLGQTREEPLGLVLVGPIAAVLIAVGTWIFTKHPIDE